jgi:hypothetical protein
MNILCQDNFGSLQVIDLINHERYQLKATMQAISVGNSDDLYSIS